MNTILQGHDKEEILEPAICALRHVTSRHSHAAEAQDIVRNVNGLLPIVDLLNPNVYSWPTVKSTISLIRNLALSNENFVVIRESGAIDKLAQLLVRTHQEFQRQPNVDLIDNYIRMDDILESCISALHIIAKDPQNRMVIRDLDCVPLFVRVSNAIEKDEHVFIVIEPNEFVFSYFILRRPSQFNAQQRELCVNWSMIEFAQILLNNRIVHRN